MWNKLNNNKSISLLEFTQVTSWTIAVPRISVLLCCWLLQFVSFFLDDILIARKKLKQAEEDSDVVTDSETVTLKRKRKKNYKYIDEHNDGDSNNRNEEQICDNEANFDCDLNNNNKEQISDDETNLNSVSLLDSLRRFRKPSKNKYPLPPRHSEHPQPVETSVSGLYIT